VCFFVCAFLCGGGLVSQHDRNTLAERAKDRQRTDIIILARAAANFVAANDSSHSIFKYIPYLSSSTFNLKNHHNFKLSTTNQQIINMSSEEGEWIDVSVAQDGGVMKKITEEAPEGASGPPPAFNEVTAH
jgi:phosphopantothenoylcysteine synthetase/decarboxylase